MLTWGSEVSVLVKRILIRRSCEDDRRRILQSLGRSDPLSVVVPASRLREYEAAGHDSEGDEVVKLLDSAFFNYKELWILCKPK